MLPGAAQVARHQLLLANVISLGCLTLVRFAVADRVIWRSADDRSSHYDVHGLVTLESAGRAARAGAVRGDRLDFAGPDPDRVRALLERCRRHGRSRAPTARTAIAYRERPGSAVVYDFGETTVVTTCPFLRYSPHVLYTNCVEPLLRWTFAEQGYALVHAACVTSGDRAFLITARTDTGKTTTILKTLDNHPGYGFVSDDLTLLAPRRHACCPIRSRSRSPSTRCTPSKGSNLTSEGAAEARATRRGCTRSEGRSIGLLLAQKGLPAAAMNAVVQILIPPPKYDVDAADPEHRDVTRARSSRAWWSSSAAARARPMLEPEAALADADGELRRRLRVPALPGDPGATSTRRTAPTCAASNDARPPAALTGLPSLLLQSSTMDWWQRLPRLVDETAAMRRALGRRRRVRYRSSRAR